MRECEAITVEGEPYLRYVRERWGVEAIHMPSFVHWSETGGKYCARPGATDGPMRVIFAGQINLDKGVVELAEAVARLHGRVDISLEYLGVLKSGPKERLEHVVRKHDLGDVIRFAGALPREQFIRKVAEGQVFALPTYHPTEGHSNALTEAMALGLAIVSCDQGFIKAVLGPEAGILVPPRDVGALADALERLSANPGLRARMGAAAQQRARSLFSDEVILVRWESLYARLLDDNGCGRSER